MVGVIFCTLRFLLELKFTWHPSSLGTTWHSSSHVTTWPSSSHGTTFPTTSWVSTRFSTSLAWSPGKETYDIATMKSDLTTHLVLMKSQRGIPKTFFFSCNFFEIGLLKSYSLARILITVQGSRVKMVYKSMTTPVCCSFIDTQLRRKP